MAFRPHPVEIRCPACGWHKTWHPASDALELSDLPPLHCPRCKHSELESRTGRDTSGVWALLKQLLAKG